MLRYNSLSYKLRAACEGQSISNRTITARMEADRGLFFFGSPVGNAVFLTSCVVYRIYGWAGPTCDMIPAQYKRTTVDLRIVLP